MASPTISRDSWLLLLPCPPSDISYSTLSVAYGPGLTRVLQNASQVSASASGLTVDIAIAYKSNLTFPYYSVQNLLGGLYRLICVICTELTVDPLYDNDVDTRLILFGYDHNVSHMALTTLQTLARCKRVWQRIFSLEGEPGQNLVQKFMTIRTEELGQSRNVPFQQRVPGGLSMQMDHYVTTDVSRNHHNAVAVGGTFDHLHAGHKLLLTMTTLVLNPDATRGTVMIVGITGDELLKKKAYRDVLEDFNQRQSAVQHFLLGVLELSNPEHILKTSKVIPSSKPHGREVHNVLQSGLVIKFVEIFDPCGPTITDESITALVLSAETRAGGKVVNDKRGGNGWSPLEVFEVDVLDAGAGDGEKGREDDRFQSKISSTEIRRRIHQKDTAPKHSN